MLLRSAVDALITVLRGRLPRALMRPHRRVPWLWAAVACGAAVVLWQTALPANPVRTGTFNEAVIQVNFSDAGDSSQPFSLTTLGKAEPEIYTFFSRLSNNKLKFVISATRVTLKNTTNYYAGHCTTADTSNCTQFVKDVVAAEQAISPHFFDNVDGIALLVPGSATGSMFTMPPLTGVTPKTLERSYLLEGPPVPPAQAFGPSGIIWQSWVHEFGHQLQYDAQMNIGGNWNGHPSGYSSGYDLMDSCYPCGQAGYGLLGAPFFSDSRGAFPGWLDASHVAVVPVPSGGATSATYVLPPLANTIGTPVVQVVKVPIDSSRSYVIDARTRVNDDAIQGYSPRGLFDQGVQIEYVDETADPPMTPCSPAPGTTGCVKNPPASGPWPYPLWHAGQTFYDNVDQIQIVVDNATSGGYTVTVNRNVPSGYSNLFITPWLTPPENTYETVDIWVDSSCNGYGVLRYGTRPDGTVVGSGDDPCANHENRVYATVHNLGTLASAPTIVNFEVTSPLGVGVTGTWKSIGTASLPAVSPGGQQTVYVPWTPAINLSAAQIQSSHFNFHTCIQVTVVPPSGDLASSNKQAQENIDVFEAVAPAHGPVHYPPIHRTMYVGQLAERLGPLDPRRLFVLTAVSKFPPGWTYKLNNGTSEFRLGTAPYRLVPVDIFPAGGATGNVYRFKATVWTSKWLYNDAIPASDPRHRHFTFGSVGGVTLDAHTVAPSRLVLRANPTRPLGVTGQLTPVHAGVFVAIDYTNPSGTVRTFLARTDAQGMFSEVPDVSVLRGTWQARALWQGDMDHASALSNTVRLKVGQTSSAAAPPPPPAFNGIVVQPRPQRTPAACLSGYVWREANADDPVCVTPEVRQQTAADNAAAAGRTAQGTAPNGARLCLPGFVWRQANAQDYVCVSPETRKQAAEDNATAASRTVQSP